MQHDDVADPARRADVRAWRGDGRGGRGGRDFRSSGQAQAQATGASKLQEVLKRGKLVVGTGTTNPPWHFEDDSGNLTGMDIDMARLLAKGLFDDPTKVEFVRQAADARIPNLLTNKIDIVAQFMTITPGRARQVEFTTPYYREGVGLLVLKDSKYKNFADLKAAGANATIAWLQNVGVEDYTRMVLPDIKILQVDSVDATFQSMNAHRADVTAVGPIDHPLAGHQVPGPLPRPGLRLDAEFLCVRRGAGRSGLAELGEHADQGSVPGRQLRRHEGGVQEVVRHRSADSEGRDSRRSTALG